MTVICTIFTDYLRYSYGNVTLNMVYSLNILRKFIIADFLPERMWIMLKILKKLRRTDFALIGLAVLFIVAQVWLELRLPDYMSEITRLVQTSDSAMRTILLAGGKMLLCALGSVLASVAVAILAARVASGFGATLRRGVYTRVQSFSMAEIGKFSNASLITRSTNDVTQVQMVIVMGLQAIIKAPIMASWAITKISGKSAEWTFSTAVAVGILLLLVLTATLFVLPKFKRLQRLTDDLNRVTRENLNGLRVVRAYNAESYQEQKFVASNKALTETELFTVRAVAILMPMVQLVMSGLSLAVYWLGAVLIDQAGMQERIILFSDMIVFSQYAMQVVMSFIMVIAIFIFLPRASVSAKRILEVLETPLSIHDGAGAAPTDLHGEIEFRDVSFVYPDAEEAMLEDISFTAKQGETVAIIGATGSGKSTLINLVPRFYDATKGAVLVNGVDVRDYKLHELREKIGYISQKAVMFSGTVRSNVTFGGDVSADITDAIDTAQAADFVAEKPKGHDSFVAQSGSNLSGGQKQRLSIARALQRRPEILIFDDSFSALDYKTDRELRRRLAEDHRDSTKLIVAQRIGTIRDADRIIVLEDGKIAGMGKHAELMASCEVYRQIAYSQLSKEELA